MAQLFKGMPRHYKLKERIAELNKLWEIRPTPPGTTGIQQLLQKRLKFGLENLLSINTFVIQLFDSTWLSECVH